MIFQARYGKADFATVVLRAKDAHEAFTLAVECGMQYIGDDVGGVSVEPIEPDGASGVLIEDWS